MENTNKFSILFLMYIVQKIFLCFSWAVFPIVLRKQGLSLGGIGFTALVYSPWCLKFLYAPLADRCYSRKIGKRKSWIAPLLLLSCAGVPLLSFFPPEENLGLLLAAVFAMNWIFSATDVAVDAYATDILTPRERPWGNAAQMTGYILGYMLGSGVFLIVYQDLGWKGALLLIAALQALLTAPIILHREMPPASPAPAPEKQVSLPENGSAWSFVRQPQILWFCLLSMMLIILDRGASQIRLPMFVDLGMDAAALGRLNIWVGAPLSILGSVLGGWALNKTGTRPAFILCCLGCIGLHCFSAAVSLPPYFSELSAGIIIGAEKLLAGVVFILVFSMIMSLSAGSHSAGRYAILGSAFQAAGLGVMPVMGVFCDFAGYFQTFLGLAAFGALTLFTGLFLLRRHLNLQTI